MNQQFEINYSTIIPAPLEKVWAGLTDAAIVKQYFFGTNQKTTWKKGDPILFEGEWEGKPYVDKGVVLDYVHNQRAAYSYLSSWSGLADEPQNYLRVAYHVESVDDGTKVTITQTNYDEEKAKHSEQTWKLLMDEMRKLIAG